MWGLLHKYTALCIPVFWAVVFSVDEIFWIFILKVFVIIILDQVKDVLFQWIIKYLFYSEAFDLRHEIRESSSHAEAEEFAQNGDEVKI